MPAVTDLEGFTYLQRGGHGAARPLRTEPTPLGSTARRGTSAGRSRRYDRSPELTIGSGDSRFQETGIKRWVNGAFTFTPDGNPLVGPVDGVPGYWAACGVMAGFSQGAGIGLALANWIVDGDPGVDAFGMDVARFGDYAAEDTYLRATTAQFYARRFVMAFPNEELPAGRPLKTTPCYEDFVAANARFTVNFGLEVPLYFAPSADFEEHDTRGVGRGGERAALEVLVRGRIVVANDAQEGAYEIAQYARYEVSGPGAEAWLDHLVAGRIPSVGRIRLTPMLNPAGRLMGDLTVARLDEDRFWLTGSYYLQPWHMRWFHQHLPPTDVSVRNITDDHMGFSVSGPAAREIVAKLTREDLATDAFPFLGVRAMEVKRAGHVGRSLTGELGYEIVVPRDRHRPGRSCRTPGRARSARSATARSTACAWRRGTGSGRPSSGRRTPARRGSPVRRLRQGRVRRARGCAARP
jgi:dimethylglycine dehydrogenase